MWWIYAPIKTKQNTQKYSYLIYSEYFYYNTQHIHIYESGQNDIFKALTQLSEKHSFNIERKNIDLYVIPYANISTHIDQCKKTAC